MAWSDQSTIFINNSLLTHQRMDQMAENDKFLYDFRNNLVTFSAYNNANQAMPAPTAAKLNFNTEEWDSHSAFDTTNMRFTAPVSGKYILISNIQMIEENSTPSFEIFLYRNGSLLHYGDRFPVSDDTGEVGWGIDTLHPGPGAMLSVIVDATLGQYFEIWAVSALVSQNISMGPYVTYFQGALLQKTP